MGKKSKYRPRNEVVMTESKLRTTKRQIAQELFQRMFLLFAAAIQDELKLSNDDLYRVFKCAERYSNHLEAHRIGMNDIAKILRERGLPIDNWM